MKRELALVLSEEYVPPTTNYDSDGADDILLGDPLRYGRGGGQGDDVGEVD